MAFSDFDMMGSKVPESVLAVSRLFHVLESSEDTRVRNSVGIGAPNIYICLSCCKYFIIYPTFTGFRGSQRQNHGKPVQDVSGEEKALRPGRVRGTFEHCCCGTRKIIAVLHSVLNRPEEYVNN